MNMEARRRTATERRAWWSARRRRYNLTLFVAALISAAMGLTVAGLFEERLPCLEITGVIVIFQALLFLIGVGLANICYFLGPLSERLIRPRNVPAFRRSAYCSGVAFSLLLIFAPPLLISYSAFIGPAECTDKFGERHISGPAAATRHEAK
jgi:hypothetical protein